MMKEYVILIFLSSLFVPASFMVFITRGKNSYLLKKKLRIGALIISITAIVGIISGCKPHDKPRATCYEVEIIEDTQGTNSSGNEINQTGIDQ